jgi:hypothetical protein
MSRSFSKFLHLNVIFCLLLFISCKKDEVTTPRNNCEFIQNDADLDGRIDDVESRLLDNCEASKLTSKNDIEANLIGEWELVGHGEGWVATFSQPCSYITITDDELIFDYHDNFLDTITTHQWSVKELPNQNFTIELTPDQVSSAISLTVFCNEYMFSNATPLDGNMYLYQKVN